MEISGTSSLPSTPQADTDSWAYTKFKVVKYSFKWILDNFSFNFKKSGESLLSPTFPTDGDNDKHKWRLIFYPRGEDDEDYLSLFLDLAPCNATEVRAKYQFSILNASEQETNVNYSGEVRVFTNETCWGFKRFIRHNILLDNAAGLLPDDKLTLCCEVSTFVDAINISGLNRAIQVPECYLSDEFGKLLKCEKLSDVILISADRRELPAHKAILAARSVVFSDMFECEMKENILGRVDTADMDFEVLQEMLYYIYTGKVSSMEKRPEDLLKAADKYALDQLKVMCENHLCTNLSVVNAAEVLLLADVHSADLLKERTIDFINMHADVMDTAGWQEIYQTRPRLVAEVFQALAAEMNPLLGSSQKRQKL